MNWNDFARGFRDGLTSDYSSPLSITERIGRALTADLSLFKFSLEH
jgi:hypothetical protein